LYDHINKPKLDKDGRGSAAKKVTILGLFVNSGLSAGKFIAGIAGGSAAMIADAVHSLSDIVTDLMVYISVHVAQMEADEGHPYGHGRAETIGAAALGALLVLVGVLIMIDTTCSIAEGNISIPTWPALLAAILSIVFKETLYQYTARIGRELDNQAIMANAWHHRTDALSSIAALLGISGAMMGFPILDPLAAIVVALLIAEVGREICWNALKELMDTSLSPDDLKEIGIAISQTPGVLSYHELRSRKMGGDKFIDVHIEVQCNMSITEAHNVSENVRSQLKKLTGAIDVLVHADTESDMDYKVINLDRTLLEDQIMSIALEDKEILSVSHLVIHYITGKILVEFSVELNNSADINHCKDVVNRLRQELETKTKISQAAIRLKLTDELFD
jgi:cation diffusion facilitator family transporter